MPWETGKALRDREWNAGGAVESTVLTRYDRFGRLSDTKVEVLGTDENSYTSGWVSHTYDDAATGDTVCTSYPPLGGSGRIAGDSMG